MRITRNCGALGQRGFTLLEIAVVLTIIGILLTTAMPGFSKYVRKAKTTEAIANLETIRVLARSYYLDHRSHLTCSPMPATIPGTSPARWKGDDCWNSLGFQPEHGVLYQYEITLEDGHLTVHARGDLDGDGETSHYSVSLDGLEVAGTNGLE